MVLRCKTLNLPIFEKNENWENFKKIFEKNFENKKFENTSLIINNQENSY